AVPRRPTVTGGIARRWCASHRDRRKGPWEQHYLPPCSGVDGVLVIALTGDGDLPRLGPLGDRDVQGQHPRVVAGGNVLGIEVVAENQLAAEHAPRTFGGDQFGVAGARGTFGLDG